MIRTLSVMIAVALVASSAVAAEKRVGKRQEKQQKRIAEGVMSGELTRKEAVKLEAQQARLQHQKKEMREDGKLTTSEKIELEKKQDKLSKKIYKEKHDKQERP